LHGHRYRVVARLQAATLDKTGMAYDFSKLKMILAELVKKYDHKCLNEIKPFDKINPTAENIARTVHQQLLRSIKEPVELDSIEIWESPESCATYKPE
jgi:6-pyruvoyltetrahydropterin/6-carboxytetrahydropterin synthase